MTKVELRREFLARRRALTAADVERRSESIARQFFDYLEQEGFADAPGYVHAFLPIRRHNEVDTWPIITRIWGRFVHVGISVPIVKSGTRQMAHYDLTDQTTLVENKLGIPEPAPESRYETDVQRIKIVLVPLLAFDQQGHRVGYGGGYYDRFLAEEVPTSWKIGLSLFGPVRSISDTESTDVLLNACITPTQAYKF